jgi:phytoene dehydrogenase-like protein
MDKSIIIIESGIAGLSAGCYAQMNGYRTHIFERFAHLDGLHASWARGGYNLDGCLHWLLGAGSDSAFYRVWQELGIAQQPMAYPDEFVRVEELGGKSMIVYTNIDRLEQHMKALSPADTSLIDTYIGASRRFAGVEFHALPILTLRESLLRVLPIAGDLPRWTKTTMASFGARFEDPFLRRAFPLIHDCPSLPMAVHLANLAAVRDRTSAWPIGGFAALCKAIEARYRNLGGEVRYRAQVDRVIVEHGRATGIRLTDGSEHYADVVILAADGHTALPRLVERKHADRMIREYYDKTPKTADPAVHISFGADRDLSGQPHSIVLLLDRPISVAGEMHERLIMEHFSLDPCMVAAGKSVIKVYIKSSFDYWERLPRSHRRAKKRQVVESVIEQLEQRFPGLREQIEVVDVVTPTKNGRFTDEWHGLQPRQPEGVTLKAALNGMSRTLPGLQSFYVVGHQAGVMGSLPMAAAAGHNLVKDLCRRDRQPFKTSLPSH